MKEFSVKVKNSMHLDVQVLKNICLYCMGDFYLSHDFIECRFEKIDQRNEFLANLDDLGIKPIK